MKALKIFGISISVIVWVGFSIAYVLIGFFQILVIKDMILISLGWNVLFCYAIAVFACFIPPLAAILGVIGAHAFWGWSLLGAGLFFGAPYLLIFLSLAAVYAFAIVFGILLATRKAVVATIQGVRERSNSSD